MREMLPILQQAVGVCQTSEWIYVKCNIRVQFQAPKSTMASNASSYSPNV
jgi:hypothetical protein